MNKKDLKRFFKQHEDFTKWLKQNTEAYKEVRNKPEEVSKWWEKYQKSQRKSVFPEINFRLISERTRQMSEALSNVQSIMDAIAEYSSKKKQSNHG